MTQENKKIIDVKSSVVIKKSPDFKSVKHKANASLSEDEAIERNTVGNFKDDKEDKEDD